MPAMKHQIVASILFLLTMTSAKADDQKEATYSLADLLWGVVLISALVGLILACTTTSWSGTETTCKPPNGVVDVRIVANSIPRRGKCKKLGPNKQKEEEEKEYDNDPFTDV